MITIEQIIKTYLEKSNDDIYFKSYTDALNHVKQSVEEQGYDIDSEDWTTQITFGQRKPSEYKTNSFHIILNKNDKKQKKKLHLQIYNIGNNNKKPFELNYYIS
jgi:hypothetical protein